MSNNPFAPENQLPQPSFDPIICVGNATIDPRRVGEPQDDKSGRIVIEFTPDPDWAVAESASAPLTLWVDPRWLESDFNPARVYAPCYERGLAACKALSDRVRKGERVSGEDAELVKLYRDLGGFQAHFYRAPNDKGVVSRPDTISKLTGDQRESFNEAFLEARAAGGLTVEAFAVLIQDHIPEDLGFIYWAKQQQMRGEPIDAFEVSAFEPLSNETLDSVAKSRTRSKYAIAFAVPEE